MSKLLLIFPLFLLNFLNLFAQTNNLIEHHTEFTIQFGSQKFHDFSELNNDFSKKGIGNIKDNSFYYGASFRKHFSNSFILGISFNTNFLFNKYNIGDSSHSKFNQIGGSVDLGYELLNTNQYSLYPMLSLGINANAINIKKYLQNEISWDDLYNSKQIASNEIRRTDLILKLAFVFNYIIDPGLESYNIPIGIEIGGSYNLVTLDDNYLYTMSGTGIKVNNFPDLYRSSFYISFVVGLRVK